MFCFFNDPTVAVAAVGNIIWFFRCCCCWNENIATAQHHIKVLWTFKTQKPKSKWREGGNCFRFLLLIARSSCFYNNFTSFFLFLGDSLFGLFESSTVPSGCIIIIVVGLRISVGRRRSAEYGISRRWSFAATVGYYRIEIAFQHVHVPRLVGSSAHLPRRSCCSPDRLRTAGSHRKNALPIHSRRWRPSHAIRSPHA